ncbi:MAG: hypothetical protein VYA84_00565 [Planctomycetota bacterium]|nr:hypothetical protein [Planctomycetota bacterium]
MDNAPQDTLRSGEVSIYWQTLQQKSKICFSLGYDYTSPKQIRTKIKKELAKDPGSAKGSAASAWAYHDSEESDNAVGDATEAIELCPEAYLPWHVCGTS